MREQTLPSAEPPEIGLFLYWEVLLRGMMLNQTKPSEAPKDVTVTLSQAPVSAKLGEAPLPEKLREVLGDFPEYILQLEGALAKVVAEPASIATPLERAVWAIEGVAEALNVQARMKLASAKDGGDVATVAVAQKEVKVVGLVLWKEHWAGDAAFVKFFQNLTAE